MIYRNCCVGAKNLEKEYLEVHAAGESFLLHDFVNLVHLTGSKSIESKSKEQDKGQPEQFNQFRLAISGQENSLISAADSLLSTEIALTAWREWKND